MKPYDRAERGMIMTPFSELDLLTRFYYEANKQPVLMDVGAGDGRFSKPFANGGWRVVAIENDAAYSQAFQERLAGYKDIHLIPSSSASSPPSGSSGMAVAGPFDAEAVHLDHVLRSLGLDHVSLLKINSGGAGLPVLKTFDFDRIHPEVVMCEYLGDNSRERFGYTLHDIARFMITKNYYPFMTEWESVNHLSGDTPLRFRQLTNYHPDQEPETGSFIFIRHDKLVNFKKAIQRYGEHLNKQSMAPSEPSSDATCDRPNTSPFAAKPRGQNPGLLRMIEHLKANLDHMKQHAKRQLTMVEIHISQQVDRQASEILKDFCKTHHVHFISTDAVQPSVSQGTADGSMCHENYCAEPFSNKDIPQSVVAPAHFIVIKTDGLVQDGERRCQAVTLTCVTAAFKKLSARGMICLDSTWYEDGKWQGAGAQAVPYLLKKDFCVSLTADRSVVLTPDRSARPASIINTLDMPLEYHKKKEINSLMAMINAAIQGRVCTSKHLHGLYLIKKFMGSSCKVYVETGSLFGGSLCLVMQDALPCTFVGIDLFDGYYGKKNDPISRTRVTLEKTRENIDMLNVHRHPYHLLQGSSYAQATIEKFRQLNMAIDLLFIDGDHSYQGVINDYVAYKDFMNPDGFIIFDNYGQPNAWEEVETAVSDIPFEKDGFQEIGQYGFSYIVRKR